MYNEFIGIHIIIHTGSLKPVLKNQWHYINNQTILAFLFKKNTINL